MFVRSNSINRWQCIASERIIMVSHSCRDVSAGTPLPSLITAPDNARAIEMANITYEIVESIAVLSESSKGWTKELNLISWNDRDPKYDIREWSPDHEKMGKGVTLSDEEVAILKKALDQRGIRSG